MSFAQKQSKAEPRVERPRRIQDRFCWKSTWRVLNGCALFKLSFFCRQFLNKTKSFVDLHNAGSIKKKITCQTEISARSRSEVVQRTTDQTKISSRL